MMGLLQIFGSSPALPLFSQAFLVFTIFLAVFPSPSTPQAGSFPPPPTSQENPGASLMRRREGVCAFWYKVGGTDPPLLL